MSTHLKPPLTSPPQASLSAALDGAHILMVLTGLEGP
jgi:hypothetical protein